MKERKGKLPEWLKEDTLKSILQELSKENLTFGELLQKCGVSRSTLTIRLKELCDKGEIKKIYDSEKDRIVYSISKKALIDLKVDGMIRYLGVMATHHLLYQKLTIPSSINLEKELNTYLETLEKSNITPKEVLDRLEKRYSIEFLRKVSKL